MSIKLPELDYENLLPTRDYLRDVSILLSSLQREYIPKHPRQWEYGLEVNLRGLVTKELKIGDDTIHASLDLVKNKVRIGSSNWNLNEYSPPEILLNFRAWLESHGQHKSIENIASPATRLHRFNSDQAHKYAESLWWMEKQFTKLKVQLSEGITSPILLYPHHFDLSLAWFPFDDENMLAIGFSSGDTIVPEPYLYLYMYPEAKTFKKLEHPIKSHWHSDDFSGLVVAYADLRTSKNPEALFNAYAQVMVDARGLMK